MNKNWLRNSLPNNNNVPYSGRHWYVDWEERDIGHGIDSVTSEAYLKVNADPAALGLSFMSFGFNHIGIASTVAGFNNHGRQDYYNLCTRYFDANTEQLLWYDLNTARQNRETNLNNEGNALYNQENYHGAITKWPPYRTYEKRNHHLVVLILT